MKLDHIAPSANVFEAISILQNDFDAALIAAQSAGFWQGVALAFGLVIAAIVAMNFVEMKK